MKHSYCEGCTYLNKDPAGHCYIFKEMPKSTCMQHSELKRIKIRPIDVFAKYLIENELIKRNGL